MARRQTLHDVEVVDDDLDPDAAAPSAAPSRRRHRRALTAGAAGLAVLVAGAVAAQVVTDRREDARIAAVAALPGAVAPLAGPPQILWGMTGDAWRGVEARAGDGMLVGVRHSTEGPVVVSARDPRTGDVVWEVELVDGTTRPAPDTPDGQVMASSGSCAPLPEEQHRVVCLVHDGMAVTNDDGWHAVPASVARVVVLDSRDGSLSTDLSASLAPTSASSLTVVGDLVVTSAAQPAPEIRAVTTDGERAWAHLLPEGPPVEASYVRTMALGDLVAAVTPTAVRLLDAGGEVVRDVPVPPESDAWWSDQTSIYVQPRDETGAGGSTTPEHRTTVVRPDGLVEVTGGPVGVTVDDGSVPGLVLTTGSRGTLRAWDADGRETWSTQLPSQWGAVVLDGRLHLTSGTALITLDARTGEELWRSEAISTPVVTDGRHLLGVAAATDGEMVALDPVDGSELWRSAVPEGTASLETYLHLLLAFTFDETDGTSEVTVLG